MTVKRGLDVSHWSGTIDWPTVRRQPEAQFVIAKCTESVDFVDSQYAANRAGCLAQQIPFAAYHFYRHNGKPTEQADWFASHIGDGVDVAVCDVETTTANTKLDTVLSGSVLSLTSLAADVYTFCERLLSHGLEPAIYTSPGFAKSYLQDGRLVKYPLWIAHIGVTKPTIPYPWNQYGDWESNSKVPLWQDTWTLQVEGVPEQAVDGNLFTNAAGNLYDWFGNGTPYQEGNMPVIRVNTPGTYANIRNKPYGTITGKAPHGLYLSVTNQANDANGKLWYACGTGWVASWVVEVVG